MLDLLIELFNTQINTIEAKKGVQYYGPSRIY